MVAGLPNIIGTLTGNTDIALSKRNDAFKDTFFSSDGLWGGNRANNSYTSIVFNASHSNKIYGLSDTVTPNSLECRLFMRY